MDKIVEFNYGIIKKLSKSYLASAKLYFFITIHFIKDIKIAN